MTHSSLLARLGLWRVTRHEAVRRFYERLEAAGVVFAQLDRFERPTDDAPPVEGPAGVTIQGQPAAEGIPAGLADDPVAPDDRLVLARRDGTVVGYCCLSNRPVYVPELHRRLTFPGAYLWRLYVTPSERGRGIGTAVVAAAVRETGTALDVGTLTALVAPDNRPSRKAFAGLGFSPTERFTSVGFRGRVAHRRRPLDTGT